MSAVTSTMAESALQVRALYRNLLRASRDFATYNFREYAARRTRDAFRQYKNETDPQRVQELVQHGLKELDIVKRQTLVSRFFQLDKLVIEGGASGAQKGNRSGIMRQKEPGWT